MAVTDQNTPVIELRDVSLKFGSNTVLRQVSLAIMPLESYVLIGLSGQGKTAMLKLLAGLIEPTSGEVLWNGRNARMVRGAERNEWIRHTGMLFQKNALFDSMTVFENVAFPLTETKHMDTNQIRERVDYFLDGVGLLEARDLFPSEISGGMQKRLGIARALALDPKIIFYDDPTAGLDPITSRKIIQLILDLKKKMSSTIVTVTNDMHRAFQLADRMGMVMQAELVHTGNIDETKNYPDDRVQQFINGRLQGPLTRAQ